MRIIIIVISIIIVLIYLSYKNKKIKSNLKESALQFDGNKEDAVEYLTITKKEIPKVKPKVKAEKYFNVANVYRYNIQNVEKKVENYNKVLQNLESSIARNDYNNNSAIFLLNKILADEKVDQKTKTYARNLFDVLNDIERKRVRILQQRVYNVVVQPRVENLVNNPIVVRDDKHNVHDSTFLSELKMQFNDMNDNLSEGNIPDIGNFLKTVNLSPEKKRKLESTLKVISDKKFTNLNMTERQILNAVWKRIHHPDNELNKNQLKEILVENLIDCTTDEGYTHCMTGRVGRVFTSLAAVDPIYGVLRTDSIIRKEAFDKSGHVYTETVNNNLTGKYANAANYSQSGKGEVTTAEEKEFNDMVLENIVTMLNKDYGHIDKKKLDNIITTVKESFF